MEKSSKIFNYIRKSTPKQKAAVKYCEKWLNIEFEGNINSYNDCYCFLRSYLEMLNN